MKYTGTIKWVNPDDTRDHDIPICFIRADQIEFETEYDNYKYDVTLHRRGEVFRGTWRLKGLGQDNGPVTGCLLYPDGDLMRLKGRWIEGGNNWEFNAVLQRDDK